MYLLKILGLLLGIVMFNLNIQAQDWGKVKRKEKQVQKLIQEKEYKEAIYIYKRILKETPGNANIQYKIGLVFFNNINSLEDAITWFNESSKSVSVNYNPDLTEETNAPVEAFYYLSVAYHLNHEFDKAIDAITSYESYVTEDHKKLLANQHLNYCRNAKTFLNNPIKVEKFNLGRKINNKKNNTNYIKSGDGNTLAYTTEVRNGYEIYILYREKELWSEPFKITKRLGRDKKFKTASFSNDGKSMYLIYTDTENSDIYISHKKKKKWSKAVKLEGDINSQYQETYASVSLDGNTLYFVSDRPGGKGKADIYTAKRDNNDKWTDISNLGDEINTPFNEASPFVTADNQYLYFSSEGHKSMGGYDVFFTNLNEEKAKVINLGAPLNTVKNDVFYLPEPKGNPGHISRDDEDSRGKQDIYYIKYQESTSIKGKLIAEETTVFDTKNIQIQIRDKGSNEPIALFHPENENGDFNIRLQPGKYEVEVKSEKFEDYTKTFSAKKASPELVFPLNINLTVKQIAEEITEEKDTTINTPVIIEKKEIPVDTVIHIAKEITTDTIPAIIEEKIVVAEPEPQVIEEPIVIKEPVVVEEIRTIIPEETIPPITNEIPDLEINGRIFYTVQIMALKNPVNTDYFKDLENVKKILLDDGLYHYIIGEYDNDEEAWKQALPIIQKGYSDAFVRLIEGKS